MTVPEVALSAEYEEGSVDKHTLFNTQLSKGNMFNAEQTPWEEHRHIYSAQIVFSHTYTAPLLSAA